MRRRFCDREWNIEPCGAPSSGSPLVLLFSGEEGVTDALRAALASEGVADLWLAFPLGIDWDRDYTPWPAAGAGGRTFAGKAGELMILIPNQKHQFATGFLAPCFVKRLDNTYSIFCAVFLA